MTGRPGYQPTSKNARRRRRRWAFLCAVAVVTASCGQPPRPSASSATLFPELSEIPPTPAIDQRMAEAGAVTYAGSCASCHGGDLAGQPDWKTPLADGSYPAPPHDASGHTWHHSTPSLVELIRDGSADTRSSMPSFADRLTDDEILSVIEFLRSRWGDVERNWQWQITWMEARRRGE